MGRPPKTASKVKKHRITVRLSDTELVDLFKKAERVRLSPSSFLRNAGLNQKLPLPIPEINLKTYQELSRIGNNLNQFLRYFHRGQAAAIPSGTLEELAEYLLKVRQELRCR